MIRTTSRGLSLAVSMVLGVGFAATALAQQQPATKAEASGQLEDIVITATKRTSTVQETPISVTAVTGEDIQERGLADFTALAESVPGLSMRTAGPGQTEFEMRGMSSAGGNSATVGFYLDDVPLSAPAAAQNGKVVIDPNLYDLNHVEVLRGPQGTLYGSSSMGGTIKVVPNAPNPAGFDSSVQAIFGDTSGGGFNHAENAMVNLPLGDTAALRIVGTESHDSGWIDRVVIADGQFPAPIGANRGNVQAAPVAADYKRVNDTFVESARASLLWNVTDKLTVTPSFMYQRTYAHGLSDIDSTPLANANYQPFDQAEPFSDQVTINSVNIQYHFGSFDLNSTTAWWNREEYLRQDGSEEIADIIGIPYYASQGGFGPTTPTPTEDDKSKETTEEIRLTSTGDTAFKWLLGYFYGDFRSDWDLYVLQPGALGPTGTGDGFTQFQPTKIVQNSFFGEASYQLTSQLKATVGLRHYFYDSSVSTTVGGYLSPSGGGNFVSFNAGETDQGINPKFDLSYQFDKNLLVYATAAKGFRPGGGNQPIPTSGALGTGCETQLQAIHGTSSFVNSPLAFSPDNVWSYELGEKWRTAGGRLTVNGAAYYEKWNGIQQYISLSCGFPYTDNAGDAQIYGAELELNAVLVQGLTFSANAGYTHAVIVGTPPNDVLIQSGTQVQDVPSWTSSQSLVYRHGLGNDLSLIARGDNNYVGGHYDYSVVTFNHLPSYDLTNLRLGLEGGNWTSTLFAKNVFNKRALLGDVSAINVSVPQFARVAESQPATFGIDLSWRFR